MENGENMTSVEEELKLNALSENSKITEILEYCFQPETKEELENIHLKFQEKVRDYEENEYFSRFDHLCMYALDYVYNHDTLSFSAVSRTLFLYQMQYQLVLQGTNRNVIYNCDNGCFLKQLRQFRNLHTYEKTEEMLVDVGLGCILSANLGCALYLVKYSLIEFPSEVNEKCRKMFEILVDMFNSCSKPFTANVLADEMGTSIRLDELLKQVKEREVNIRRSIITFGILVIVAEYRMYEIMEARFIDLKTYAEHKKSFCLKKLMCIDLYIQATMDLIITFKDIETFTEKFLIHFVTAEIGASLVETSRKILGEVHSYYNPRSLKDLARFKIRWSLNNSMSIPEQVNELKIPDALKKFLNFHREGIWELLVINHINLSFEHKLRGLAPEEDDGNAREVDNGNDREAEDINVHEDEDGNDRENDLEAGDGNVREAGDGNVRKDEDENTQASED